MAKFDPGEIDIALQPKQEQLYRLLKATGEEVPTHLGFGGARGGAKSGGSQRCALALALSEPGISIMIFRRTFPDLKLNHIDKFLESWPILDQFHNISSKEIVLPNKSKIAFVFAENSKDLIRKTRGPEFKYIFIDQAEQLLEQEMKRLKTVNRWPGTKPGECKTVYLFNPGGPGTEYLKRIFHDHKYIAKERPGNYAFIQAYGWDNFQWAKHSGISQRDFYSLENDARFELFINHTDYGREMNQLPESLRMGELMGRFDAFAGQYFAGVWDESTCILKQDLVEFIIKPWWVRWTSTDWGFAHHSAHFWWATGKLGPLEFQAAFGKRSEVPVDVVIPYREFVAAEMAEVELAETMIAKTPADERKLISREWLSPDAFAKRGDARTIAEQMGDVFERHGFPAPEPADNDRIGGWRLLYNGFRQTQSLLSPGVETVTAEMARRGPMLMIGANCPELASAIPMLIRDDDELEDVLKMPTLADDVGDGFRYGYKSMLEPRNKAPRDVRALEVWHAHESMTEKHIAIAKFNQGERRNTAVISRPRGR